MAQTIQLSLVSHTNVGKTTLARTLLGRDVGEVRDEAHVTLQAEVFEMIATPEGDRLLLWDTPGFGDSLRLARRLAQYANPLGWFLGQVWDRYRDRGFWFSQQVARNMREHADVVLYLVNAAENPQDAGYIAAEMQVIEWTGKPVVVLLNQLGQPRAAAEEAMELERWRRHFAGMRGVQAVLAFDAFARCWVQESVLFEALAPLIPPPSQDAFGRLAAQWARRREALFEAALAVLTARLARAATDREALPEEGWSARLRELAVALGVRRDDPDGPKQAAMRALAQRLDNDIRAGTDRLIALHGLEGQAGSDILKRLAEHYAVREPLSEGKAAALGGIITGALAGLKADLATGGMTLGAGLLVGGVLGALGGAGLARGYNLLRGAGSASLGWTDEVLDELAVSALLTYLLIAHHGRGRGRWQEYDYPSHWQQVVSAAFEQHREAFRHIWSLRNEAEAASTLPPALKEALTATVRDVFARLYPNVTLPPSPPDSTPS